MKTIKKKTRHVKIISLLWISTLVLTGCFNNPPADQKRAEENNHEAVTEEKQETPTIVETNWSDYFNDIHGTAVIYDPGNQQYTIYNSQLALKRRSPCSTFKIISSLIALENGIVELNDSTREWSGEVFWNENWNKDMDLKEAFRTSCVWYYRQLIDDIGQDLMQKELDTLQYGNRDISDWEGRLNQNISNRALSGF